MTRQNAQEEIIALQNKLETQEKTAKENLDKLRCDVGGNTCICHAATAGVSGFGAIVMKYISSTKVFLITTVKIQHQLFLSQVPYQPLLAYCQQSTCFKDVFAQGVLFIPK